MENVFNNKQRIQVEVKRDTRSLWAESNYLKITNQTLDEVMQELEGQTTKLLYLYLCRHADNYKVILDKKDFYKWSGIKNQKTFRRAVVELIDKGYLLQFGKYFYQFRESKKILIPEFVCQKEQ